MATRFEYYNTGDDTFGSITDTVWMGQSFTPLIAHVITSIKLKLHRNSDSSPGTITVGIKATNGELPIGTDLTSGTFNGNSITTDPAGEWVTIILPACALSAETRYAIIIEGTPGWINFINWQIDNSEPTYTRGDYVESLDAGASWTAYSDIETMFEEWGEVILSSLVTTGIKLCQRNMAVKTTQRIKTANLSPRIFATKASRRIKPVTLGQRNLIVKQK